MYERPPVYGPPIFMSPKKFFCIFGALVVFGVVGAFVVPKMELHDRLANYPRSEALQGFLSIQAAIDQCGKPAHILAVGDEPSLAVAAYYSYDQDGHEFCGFLYYKIDTGRVIHYFASTGHPKDQLLQSISEIGRFGSGDLTSGGI